MSHVVDATCSACASFSAIFMVSLCSFGRACLALCMIQCTVIGLAQYRITSTEYLNAIKAVEFKFGTAVVDACFARVICLTLNVYFTHDVFTLFFASRLSV